MITKKKVGVVAGINSLINALLYLYGPPASRWISGALVFTAILMGAIFIAYGLGINRGSRHDEK